MSKNQQYAERYAAEAMEQMKRYGIPASVTLAQGILESRNGQSELSQLGNNHFGVKASKSWLKKGGDYLVYTDDKPNEKFCKYATGAFLHGLYSNLVYLSKISRIKIRNFGECFLPILIPKSIVHFYFFYHFFNLFWIF